MTEYNLKHFIYWFILSLTVIIGIHCIDYYISGRANFIQETADDPSYLSPFQNFVTTGVWRDNSIGPSSFVQRPPLTGIIIHLTRYLPFSKYASYIVALLFHAFSCLIFLKQSKYLGWQSVERTLFCFFYLLLPSSWGFLSYSISEVFAPGLLLIAFSQSLNQSSFNTIKWMNWFFIFLLYRPLFILFWLPFFFGKNKTSPTKTSKRLFYILLFSASFWEIRVITKVGFNYFSLHPIYHAENVSPFRPTHEAMSDLFRCWEYKPEEMHRFTGYCWSSIEEKRLKLETKKYVQTKQIPISSDSLYSLFIEWKTSYKILHNEGISRSLIQKEHRLIERIKNKTAHFKEHHFIQYHITTPIKSCLYLLTKSQLNLSVFQANFRGNLVMELFRLTCVLIICLGTLFCFFLSFKRTHLLFKSSLGYILILIYLVYIQRMNEERYIYPFLFILYLSIITYVSLIKRKKSV